MIASNRHVALKPLPWEPERAEAAIADIVGDALSHFDEQNFWPAHPQDDFAADGDTSAYLGATGMIWGLDYLARVGATNAVFDFRPVLRHLLEANRVAFSKMDYAAHGSLLFGDLGAGLLAMRLAPDSDTANLVYARSAANTDLPIRELMWGMPGSMLACLQMFEMTQDPAGRSSIRSKPRACWMSWKIPVAARFGDRISMGAMSNGWGPSMATPAIRYRS